MCRTGIGLGIAGIILLVQTFSASISIALPAGLSREQPYLLPWHIIAGQISANNQFCSTKGPDKISRPEETKLPSGRNYCYDPGQTITTDLPAGTRISSSLRRIDVDLAKWKEDSWLKTGQIIASIEPNEVRLCSKLEEGFFRLRYSLEVYDGSLCSFDSYAIVSYNWKRDILAFCRTLKDEIESNSDEELYRASIAASHFDHAMDLISNASFLSRDILKALSYSVKAKDVFESGQCPDLVKGLTKIRLRRFLGGPIVEFAIETPLDYDASKKWPLLISVDSYRLHEVPYADRNTKEAHVKKRIREGLIHLWWTTISHKDLHWKEYRAIYEIIKKKLNVDDNRIYLYGFCRNGTATMSLALHYPDHWAECSIVLGNSFQHLAGNALNLPMILVKGEHNQDPLVSYYDFMVKCFEYYDCRYFQSSATNGIAQVRGTVLPHVVRKNSPHRVLYTIESLSNPQAYWVKIEGRKDENFPGTIDAHVREQTIVVRTDNIDAYSLNLAQAPIDEDKPMEIVENGQSLGFVTDHIFTKRNEIHASATYIKNEHLHGPVWDVFTDCYAVVYGTSGENKEFAEISKKVAISLAKGGPCFADADLPEELIDSHNLILVGTKESNLWLSNIHEKLPVRIEERRIIADDQCYEDGAMGFILIYPNPMNTSKYVTVLSATSAAAMANTCEAFTLMESMQPADVGIFEVTDNGDIKWHITEKFNAVWDWHDEWGNVFTVTRKKHPKWRWSQWITRLLRTQLGADIAICENPFRFKDSITVGPITYRNLFNSFKNEWIVKIRLDGKSLRNLLVAPFNDISKREVTELVVDGVSFTKGKNDCAQKALLVSDLESGTKYTVALPYKAVSGQKMGVILKDYDILGEEYLIPLLKDYLCKNMNLDIDTQLDNLEFNVF